EWVITHDPLWLNLHSNIHHTSAYTRVTRLTCTGNILHSSTAAERVAERLRSVDLNSGGEKDTTTSSSG
ncbi:unnamed protein product, partial [Allacma fusca]